MSDPDPLHAMLDAALESRRALRLDRRRTTAEHLSSPSPMHVEIDGRRYVNFCSNDYLGFSRHPKIVAAAADATRAHGAGASASPLISGYLPVHASAEAALARWKGTEASVLLPSGYQANHAAVQTIAGAARAAGRRVRFLLDKLAHASLIDAVRATGLPFRVFPHNDVAKLRKLLERPGDPRRRGRDEHGEADERRTEHDQPSESNEDDESSLHTHMPGAGSGDAGDELQVVITESIFSMDGDGAPLAELAALKREHPFALVLDEAHGSGVYGAAGAGYADECGVAGSVDVFIVTLSKALGAAGGAICASRPFCDATVNFGRAYVYSTAIAPAHAAAAEAALAVLRDEPQRQQRVRALSRRVREHLAALGMRLPPGDSPILPIPLGAERAAQDAAERLKQAGLLALPVRPPTVPRNTSRLRVTLSSDHADDEVEALLQALQSLAIPR